MNNFQNYVFVTTMICLLIGLIITAIFLMKKTSNTTYPPVIDNCPDYWISSYYDLDNTDKAIPNGSKCNDTQYGCCPDNITAKSDDAGSTCPVAKCYNTKNLGITSDTCPKTMDFTNYTTCQKQTWATGCQVTWDGITNISSAC
jgi:hypothetical protein